MRRLLQRALCLPLAIAILWLSVRAQSPAAGNLVKLDPSLAAVGPPLSLQFEAWGVRPGDHDWLQWLNLFAFLWQASGSNAAAWMKWFGVEADKIWPDF